MHPGLWPGYILYVTRDIGVVFQWCNQIFAGAPFVIVVCFRRIGSCCFVGGSEVKELDSYLNSLLRCDEALNINPKTVLRVAWGGGYGAEVHQGWFVKVLLIGSPP